MFAGWFYNERIKNSVAMFGKLFNNIYVVRVGSDGNPVSQIKVPLSYGPKRKFIDRIKEQADLDNDQQVAIKLPRMSFEIVSIDYDQAAQQQKTGQFVAAVGGATAQRLYTGTPYIITYELNIYAKNQDDALQVVEQIFPYFTPQYTLSVRPFDSLPNVTEDVPVELQGVSFSDDYESPLEQRRTIIYTLNFNMRVKFYGPVNERKIIRDVTVDLYNIGVDSDEKVSSINVLPDPLDAEPDSDFGFTTTITSFIQ